MDTTSRTTPAPAGLHDTVPSPVISSFVPAPTALRRATRFAVACAVSAGVTDGVWRLVPGALHVRTDVVGYPIFADFDYTRYSDGYYLIVAVFPVLAVVLYHVLCRRGPLRVAPAAQPLFPVPVAGDEAQARRSAAPAYRSLGLAARIVLPAAVVTFEISSSRGVGTALPTGAGVAAGLAYVVAVLAVSALAVRATAPTRAAHGGAPSPAPASSVGVAATVRAAFAVVVVPLLLVVSHGTTVTVASPHRVVAYPWLPAWLVALATVAAVLWLVWRLRRPGPGRTPGDAEGSLLTFVVGPVLLYLAVAYLPGALGSFLGFDDAQGLAAAQLTFHGYFPWKDLFFIHGLLADIFDDGVGMLVFGDNRWAGYAGTTVLVAPLTILILYYFTAYMARRNRLAVLGVSLAIVLKMLGPFTDRFAFAPLLLVLFDVVLRRRSRAWCLALMAALIVECIITPEVGLLAVGLLCTLVLAEFCQRSKDQPLRQAFFRTTWCALSGLGLTLAWVIFLAATGALGGFVDYYRIFGPGHALSGAIPFGWSFLHEPSVTLQFALPAVLVMLTTWRATARFRARRAWRSLDWTMVAAASWSAIYFSKVLARPDIGHVGEVFTVSMPLVLLWALDVLDVLDRFLDRVWHRVRLVHVAPPRLATVVAIVVVAVLVPESVSVFRVSADEFSATVPTPATTPRLGYVTTGAVNLDKLEDLAAIFDRYAGPHAKIFDFSNDPGIVYYLEGRQPATRFYHVSMAVAAFAQEMLVSDLERQRPAVVVFNDSANGLPEWDGIWNMVRAYVVSQYLLDTYVPLVNADGTLVLLRDDLARHAPPLPALAGPSVTSGLYFDAPTCNWGDIPNFLAVPGEPGPTAGVAVPGTVESGVTVVTGWALDRTGRAPARGVVAVSDGRTVGTAAVDEPRPDVAKALENRALLDSGFSMTVPPVGGPIALYALNADGTVDPLTPGAAAPASVVVAGTAPTVSVGATVARDVAGVPGTGYVDTAHRQTSEQVTALALPGHSRPTAYRWLEVSSSHGLPAGQMTLTDALGIASHAITFDVLPGTTHLAVQVGSCQQWHGYGPDDLLLETHRTAARISVRLVG
ncbi:MAG TPA: hypothetical protein VMB72_00455 [Acidimicrobiales bacterium]|nr:hypothetical protein [Acidimicrobiales bacterium]